MARRSRRRSRRDIPVERLGYLCERGTGQQELLDVGAEDGPVDGAVDDARGGERIGSESGKEGERAPAAVGREALQPLAFDAPAADRGHVGLDPGLIDKDEALWIEITDRSSPARASPGNIRAMLLAGECGFF